MGVIFKLHDADVFLSSVQIIELGLPVVLVHVTQVKTSTTYCGLKFLYNILIQEYFFVAVKASIFYNNLQVTLAK